jgi:hypothetical protein
MLGTVRCRAGCTGEVPRLATLDLGGGYSIDLADADKFVNALKDAKERLQHTLRTTASGLLVKPPGHDDYSAVVANTYNDTAHQHQDWNARKQDELQALIDRVMAAIASYSETEHNNTMKG